MDFGRKGHGWQTFWSRSGGRSNRTLGVAIGQTSYRGSERRTLKTAGKQRKKVPSGPRVTCREFQSSQKTARHQAAEKAAVLHASGVCPAVLGLFPQHFTGRPPSTLFGCFPVSFQGLAFGASVAGWADRNPCLTVLLLLPKFDPDSDP